MEPSSTSTISKVSPLASITDLSRAYRSVTFSCSLWRGTTIEYLSTVFFIIRQQGVGFAVTCVGHGFGGSGIAGGWTTLITRVVVGPCLETTGGAPLLAL